MEAFVQRRQRLLAMLAEQDAACLAIIPSASLVTRSNDTEYPFRQNSDFFYLTGFNEPDAVLVLAPDAELPVQLFCQPNDPHAEVWHGRRLGTARAVAELQVDVAHSIDDLDEQLQFLMNGCKTVFCDLGNSEWLQHWQSLAAELASQRKQGNQAPRQWHDLAPWLHRERMVKSAAELELMRKAAAISVDAHKRAMRFVQPGRMEYQVAAEIHHEFAMQGASAPAYGTICGGGANACILHYTENSAELRDGDLLLIDAGAEYQGYAGDITRTFPVNGRFSETQKQLYEAVLRAQQAAFAVIKPGATLQQAHEAAARSITESLVALGILSGDVEEHWQAQSYRSYFIHGLGHWLGLDVHDVADELQNYKAIPFAPGMVITVEPGIYIPADDLEVAEQWRGMGIRIEDDVIITADGFENMTAAAPKTVEEIEAWMQQQ